MTSRYSISIQQEDDSCLKHFGSNIPHRLLQIALHVRWVSSLNPDITLGTFDRSVTGRGDVFLSEETARNIIHSLTADMGASRELLDTVIVPHIFHYVSQAENLGRQVIKFRVEILVEVDPNEEIGELVDESLASSVRFKPASKSSVEALKRAYWVDEDEDEENLLLKKRKLGEGSSSGKGCTVCLDKFSDGVDVTSMPCGHIYHYDCVVEWLKTIHLCRYEMKCPLIEVYFNAESKEATYVLKRPKQP